MSDTASFPGTMRGWAIRAYGEAMVLMDDLPAPTPGPRDVLIKMRSAEVGIWDELVRTRACDVERPFPLVLGLGGAGTIVAVGAQVKDFAEGQYVYAYNMCTPTDSLDQTRSGCDPKRDRSSQSRCTTREEQTMPYDNGA